MKHIYGVCTVLFRDRKEKSRLVKVLYHSYMLVNKELSLHFVFFDGKLGRVTLWGFKTGGNFSIYQKLKRFTSSIKKSFCLLSVFYSNHWSHGMSDYWRFLVKQLE